MTPRGLRAGRLLPPGCPSRLSADLRYTAPTLTCARTGCPGLRGCREVPGQSKHQTHITQLEFGLHHLPAVGTEQITKPPGLSLPICKRRTEVCSQGFERTGELIVLLEKWKYSPWPVVSWLERHLSTGRLQV